MTPRTTSPRRSSHPALSLHPTPPSVLMLSRPPCCSQHSSGRYSEPQCWGLLHLPKSKHRPEYSCRSFEKVCKQLQTTEGKCASTGADGSATGRARNWSSTQGSRKLAAAQTQHIEAGGTGAFIVGTGAFINSYLMGRTFAIRTESAYPDLYPAVQINFVQWTGTKILG